MAIDESVLLTYQQGCASPTVRVYQWNPPCVSLGYFQSARDVHHELCRQRGIDIVRRLTGGRAIVHTDELTYSIVVDEDTLGARGVIASFRRLSSAVIAGLQRVGIEAALASTPQRRGRTGDASCFATASRCDLVCNGRKLVGSAQVRRAGVLLQHGSIPLVFDYDLARALLPGDDDLRSRVIDARAASGKHLLASHCLAQALRVGFSETLGVEMRDDELTGDEQRLAHQLSVHKYNNDDWTCRR